MNNSTTNCREEVSTEKPLLKVELAPKNRVYNNTIRASAINSNNQMQISKVDGNEIMITKEVVAKPITIRNQQQSLQLQQQQQQQQDHQREGMCWIECGGPCGFQSPDRLDPARIFNFETRSE